MVLFISLFLYFRQKILALEEKITLLSEVTTTMAGITSLQNPLRVTQKVEVEVDEDDEDDEDDESSCVDSNDSVSIEELYGTSPVMSFMKVDPEIKNVIVMTESTPRLDMLVEHLMTSMDAPYTPEVQNALEFLPELVSDVVSDVLPELVSDVLPDVVLPELVSEVLTDVVTDVDAGLPKRVVSTDTVKTLTLDSPYDAMTLKELKEKVAETNGPKLKTKKELIEYLKNKM